MIVDVPQLKMTNSSHLHVDLWLQVNIIPFLDFKTLLAYLATAKMDLSGLKYYIQFSHIRFHAFAGANIAALPVAVARLY